MFTELKHWLYLPETHKVPGLGTTSPYISVVYLIPTELTNVVTAFRTFTSEKTNVIEQSCDHQGVDGEYSGS